MINTVSCMLLHISLGMGLKILNIIEKQTVIIDDKVKEDKGQQTPELTNIMSRLNNLSSAHRELTERVQYLKEKVEVMKRKDLFEENNSSSLRKIGKKFIFNTPQAKKIQADHHQICSEYKLVGCELRMSEKELATLLKKELESVEKEFDKQKGIFQTEFHKVLDQTNLKRRAYHSESLV